jgi:DnaJ-class molecular chaperone
MKKIQFTHPALYNEETQEQVTLNLPARRVVCPTCNGYGHHFRNDLDENSFVRECFEERDEESLYLYKAGAFNQTCSECKGQKVLDEIDWDYFNSQYPNESKMVSDWDYQQMQWEQEREWERRMGA